MSILIRNTIPKNYEDRALSMLYGALSIRANSYSLPFLAKVMGDSAFKQIIGKKATFLKDAERNYVTKDRKISWGELQTLESESRVSVGSAAVASGAVGTVTVEDARPYVKGGDFIVLNGNAGGYPKITITNVDLVAQTITYKGVSATGSGAAVNPIPIGAILKPTPRTIKENDCIEDDFNGSQPTEVWFHNYISAIQTVLYKISIEAMTDRGKEFNMKRVVMEDEEVRMHLVRVANMFWAGMGHYTNAGDSSMYGLDHFVDNPFSLANVTADSMDDFCYAYKEMNPNVSDTVYLFGDRAVLNRVTKALKHNNSYTEIRELMNANEKTPLITQFAQRAGGFKSSNGMEIKFVFDSSLNGFSGGQGLGYILDIDGSNEEFVDGQSHGKNIAMFDYAGFDGKKNYDIKFTPQNTKCLYESEVSITGHTLRVRGQHWRLTC